MPLRLLSLIILAVLFAAACEDEGSLTRDPPGASSSTIDWEFCDDSSDLNCASLDVPLDYSDPSAGTITLALQGRPSDDEDGRIGTLLVNPGGPGVSPIDTELLDFLPELMDSEITDRFDLLTWDPRGVGHSDPVDCVDNLDPYLAAIDPTPDTPEEFAAAQAATAEFTGACEQRSDRLLPYVSTQDTARDMEEIRKALGEEKISYFGFSYGSFLGATYVTMFPDSVRAAVIDGATNPSSDYVDVALEQAAGIERALTRVLDDCSADDGCAFHSGGDAAGAFDTLFADLDANPLPAPDGRPAIGQAVTAWAAISALYVQEDWDDLTRALADARDGDGSGLLQLYDVYWDRFDDGTWSDAYEGLIGINCVDLPIAPTQAEVDALAAQLAEVAPRTGPWFAQQNSCGGWPAHSPALAITGAGAGPVLVLGNTGDPVTPIESTEAMARALEDGVLVTYHGEGHTAYIEASVAGDDCVIDAVNSYLVDLEAPEGDVDCG